MTYATAKKQLGRQPVQVVEIDLDYCTHTYGVAPCTAVVGTTGSQKCFNTRKTCQDPNNYAPALKTYRFSNRTLPADNGFQVLPLVQSVTLAPTRLDPGKGIGQRASATITVSDMPFTDQGIDLYLSTRSYDSATQGTFWAKLLARNPYYQGRVLRVRSGFLPMAGAAFDWADFETRTYFIDSIQGPDAKGQYQIVAKDLLKIVDDQRAQAPVASTGTLLADIAAGALTATLAPAGIGATGYPASGSVIIGSEVIQFTRVGDVMTWTVRGSDNSTAAAHSAGDTVQLCLRYTAQTVDLIMADLLTTYGKVPGAYIDTAAWASEIATWLSVHTLTALITKPIGVATLLAELVQQGLAYIWWDERTQKIPLRAVRPALASEKTAINETANLLADSISLKDMPQDRLSQVWTYYGQILASESLDKESNFRSLYVQADLGAEGAQQYGESRIKKVYCRWIPANASAQAALVGYRLLKRYVDNPRLCTFKLDAKDSSLWTGDVATITSKYVQDLNGAATPTDFQVIEVAETKPGTEYTYQALLSAFAGRYGFIAPDATPDYLSATALDKSSYAFVGPDSGLFVSDQSVDYQII